MARKILKLSMILVLVGILCACSNHEPVEREDNNLRESEVEETKETEETQEESSFRESAAEETNEVPKETTIGYYTHTDIADYTGFLMLYDDGSFDLYPQGGYSADNGDTWNGPKYYDDFYFENEKVDQLPVVSDEDQIAVKWDGDCDVYLYPIKGESYAVRVSAEELGDEYADTLGEGYGTIDMFAVQEYYLTVCYRKNGGRKHYKIEYINGKPAFEYEFTYTEYEYTDSYGDHFSRDYYGLQRDDHVTLGISYGTTLVEYARTQDVTCFYSDPDSTDVNEEWYYAPDLKPTPEGYANIDFSGIPNGKYIMVVSRNSKYIGTILNLEN